MSKLRPNLRLRVAFAFAVFYALLVSLLGIAFYASSEKLERTLVRQLVTEEMDYVVERHRQDPEFIPRLSPNVKIYILRSPADKAALPPDLRELTPGDKKIHRGKEEFLVQVRDSDGAVFYVVYDTALYEQREQQFKVGIITAVIVVALLSLVLGYWVSGLVLRQITGLAKRVSRLAADDSDAPLTEPGQDDEVARLAHALDDYRNRITQSIRREQEFSANASHELRTPLMTLQSSCELLLGDPGLGDKARARVTTMLQAAQQMTGQLQTLLLLAREETAQREPVSLADCIKRAAEPYRAEIARKHIQLDIVIADDTKLETYLQALQLVLDNLIRNAVQHTQQGYIRISYAAPKLAVADSGSGIAADHLPHIFERHYRGERDTQGLGLGLAIVKRVCDHFRWHIEVSSTPASGSVFSITLA